MLYYYNSRRREQQASRAELLSFSSVVQLYENEGSLYLRTARTNWQLGHFSQLIFTYSLFNSVVKTSIDFCGGLSPPYVFLFVPRIEWKLEDLEHFTHAVHYTYSS